MNFLNKIIELIKSVFKQEETPIQKEADFNGVQEILNNLVVGDIIWAKITPCMQNGKSAILTNLVNGKGYGSTEFHVVRIKSSDVLPQYIYTLLRHFDVLSDAKKYFTGSAGQQRVPTSYLENLLIPVPPLEVQKQIVDEYASSIELAKQGYIKIYNYKQELKKNFENQIFE